MNDPVNHPSHYCEGRCYEPIDVIEAWGLGFHLGNALKYVSRAGRKDDEAQDYRKALWYVQRFCSMSRREKALRRFVRWLTRKRGRKVPTPEDVIVDWECSTMEAVVLVGIYIGDDSYLELVQEMIEQLILTAEIKKEVL